MNEELNARVVQVVGSEVIQHVEYNYATMRLTVHFAKTGAIWQYEDVPSIVFGQLIGAASVGAAFNSLVRNKYVGSRLNVVDTILENHG